MSGLKLLFTILRIGILAFALNYASGPSEVWVMKLLIILVALIWGITEAIHLKHFKEGQVETRIWWREFKRNPEAFLHLATGEITS